MIVGLYQCPSPCGGVNAGLETVGTALKAAAKADVDMLVLPEAFLPGYGAVPKTAPSGWGDIEHRLADLCRMHGVALTIGVPQYGDGAVQHSIVIWCRWDAAVPILQNSIVRP